jgi:hypothetical protein
MDMMRSPNENLEFEFEVKLDTGGLGRSIRIKEKGYFRFDGKSDLPDTDTTPKPGKESDLVQR